MHEPASGQCRGEDRPLWDVMPNNAQQFRDRARDCLNVAKGTRNEADRTILEDMAVELEAEARKIDAEEAGERRTDGSEEGR